MSQSSDDLIVYVNLYKLSWPSAGPKDGQIVQGFGGPPPGGPMYAPARWDWPSPQWKIYTQQRLRCDCSREEVIYMWGEVERGVRPHVNAHTREDGSTCEAGGTWNSVESGLTGNGIDPMPEEHLDSLIDAHGDWIPPYNGEKSLSETPLKEGYYLVIEDREAHRTTFYERGYEDRL